LRAYSAPPDPLAEFGGREGEGKGKRKGKGGGKGVEKERRGREGQRRGRSKGCPKRQAWIHHCPRQQSRYSVEMHFGAVFQ